MTTAFARKKGEEIEVVADKLLTGGFQGKSTGSKIYRFENGSVLANAGKHIPKEMFDMYKLEPDPIKIKEFITEHNSDGECIFVDNTTNKMYFISSTIIEEHKDFISIGSGYQAVYLQYLLNPYVNSETMIENASRVDHGTGKECEIVVVNKPKYSDGDLDFPF